MAVLLGLAALAGALYLQTLDDPWHYDDRAELSPGVRAFAPRIPSWHYRGIVVRWLWAVDYRLWGEDPRGYHVTNLLIHFAASAALYGLAWLVASGLPPPRRLLAAAVSAGLFCAHPLATQSVAYLTQRSTGLAAALSLASLGAWVAFRRGSGARRWAWGAASVAALAMGLYAKPVAFAVVPAVVLCEALGSRGAARERWLLLPMILLALWRATQLAPAVHLAGPNAQEPATRSIPADRTFTANEYALTQPVAAATYLRLAVFPRGQTLLHDLAPVRSPGDPRFIASSLALLALLALAIRLRRDRPGVALGLGLWFLALLPTSSVVRSPGLIFEHRAYLPLAGLCLAAGLGLGGAGRLPVRRAAALATVAVAALAVTAHRRVAVWGSELSLWSDAARKAPDRADARLNLGLALREAGRPSDAEREYRAACALDPSDAVAHVDLGNLLLGLGRVDEAEAELRTAQALGPKRPEPLVGLGNAAMRRGDPAAAADLYGRALALDPGSVSARFNRAKALLSTSRVDEAVAEYRKLEGRLPGSAALANDYGCALLLAGDAAAAERELRRAVALRPDWADAWRNLGKALAAGNRDDEAEAAFARGRELAASPGGGP